MGSSGKFPVRIVRPLQAVCLEFLEQLFHLSGQLQVQGQRPAMAKNGGQIDWLARWIDESRWDMWVCSESGKTLGCSIKIMCVDFVCPPVRFFPYPLSQVTCTITSTTMTKCLDAARDWHSDGSCARKNSSSPILGHTRLATFRALLGSFGSLVFSICHVASFAIQSHTGSVAVKNRENMRE